MRVTLAILLAGTLAPAIAAADPLPFHGRASVGRPARPVQVRVEATTDGARIRLEGRGEVTHDLPFDGVATAEMREIRLEGGARVALVTVTGGTRRFAVLVGAERGVPSVLWSGRLDAHGDPGEQRTDVIQVDDRTGDGTDDVIVGTRLSTHRICGSDQPALLAPRAVDPRSTTLRTIALRRLDEALEEEEVTAIADSPGPDGPPVLRNVAFTVASSAPRVEPQDATTQIQLHDRNPETFWLEGRPGPGRWEFVTGQLHASRHPVRAIALTLPPDRPGVALPHHLYLVGDDGPRLRVEIPAALATFGARVWVVPERPRSWRCLSVVLDDAHEQAGRTHVGLAEVEVYTDIDFGGGVETLVEELVADGEGGADAARLLAGLGERGVEIVTTHWPTLTAVGRRRAVTILAANGASSDAARGALSLAAIDADADVRSAALEALVDAGEPAYGELAALSGSEHTVAAAAALALARRAGDAAIPPLLDAMQAEGGSERPGLRRALAIAVERGGADSVSRLRAWSDTTPPAPAAAAAALALVGTSNATSVATALLVGLLPRVERFEDRWRFAQAARRLRSEPSVDARLAQWARSADEWMLRRAALVALGERDRARAREVAREALDDEYPRVRSAAVELLANRRDAALVRAAATGDGWPMVRAAALTALTRDPGAQDVIRRGLDDDAQLVRAAAVRALTERRDRGATSAIGARLLDDGEWPEVLSASIGYARELCRPELAEALVEVVKRGLRPNPWAPDVDLAVEAVDALGVLGGEDAAIGIRRAAAETAPLSLREAAARARQAERCSP